MFQSIRARRPALNRFDLSHERKFSCQMGALVPILLEEIVPGDRFRVSSEIMMRLAPMLSPVMHRVDVWTHYFFVPNRIVWSEWEDFITGGEDGTAQPVHPYFWSDQLQFTGLADQGTLYDYFGLPPLGGEPANPIEISALPFRAYATIYNEYYRDQNLQDKITVPVTSGQQSNFAACALQNRAWEKDYFTSALPWAQRGNAVTIPSQITYRDPAEVVSLGGVPSLGSGEALETGDGDATTRQVQSAITSEELRIENLEEIGIDINDLRRSNALQKWLELAARGGSRYIEQIKNFFGIVSSDARLQRPEYLGGGRQNVVISEVLQTTATNITGSSTPLATMAGHGVSVGNTNQFKKGPFEEHGFVLGIMSVLPKTAYQNGVHRMWRRQDKFDYYFPQFAHLGEQAILNSEIYYDNTAADYDATWGYQARYAEYKHRSSQVAGDFRTSLNFWHMGRIFDEIPPLNEEFVVSDPTQRIFANTSPEDHKLWVQIYNKVSALRPMPYFGTPRL